MGHTCSAVARRLPSVSRKGMPLRCSAVWYSPSLIWSPSHLETIVVRMIGSR